MSPTASANKQEKMTDDDFEKIKQKSTYTSTLAVKIGAYLDSPLAYVAYSTFVFYVMWLLYGPIITNPYIWISFLTMSAGQFGKTLLADKLGWGFELKSPDKLQLEREEVLPPSPRARSYGRSEPRSI